MVEESTVGEPKHCERYSKARSKEGFKMVESTISEPILETKPCENFSKDW